MYNELSKELIEKIEYDKINGRDFDFSFKDENAVRRNKSTNDNKGILRSPFVRDTDKILNCPFYNRYADKTQVFSLRKNDDISRRALHVQLVSRIARTIGKTLGLNLDLIEAISLSHDLGHTPFGHAGESFLDEAFSSHTGKRFFHNVHSIRVLDKIFPLNVTLQTLDGVISHNGELELSKYSPLSLSGFEEFDKRVEDCYQSEKAVLKLIPSTLEGCVMRISDIIAYLGKDRQDAIKANLSPEFADYGIGVINSEIVNNLTVNLIENSYGKPYIKMDGEAFLAMQKAKKDNYEFIYNAKSNLDIKSTLREMLLSLYDKLLFDLTSGVKTSPIFTHHLDYINKPYYKRLTPYEETEKNQIVVDYIASMTDDYFIELFAHLFPSSTLKIKYIGYFE
jgi:dGTPase